MLLRNLSNYGLHLILTYSYNNYKNEKDGAKTMEEEDLKYLLLSFTGGKEVTKEQIKRIKDKYYTRREKMQNYKETKKRLAQLIIEDNFPNARQWNKIARKRGLVF